ncbi:Peptidoglycan recognition protein [Araneus ventricosus]|uniref:Peptidoglycan recognition protein n=1 Tax=Araneus ventricosus TaxID=182803 RepID=A0A4Y2NKG7_ARAVE|nr:Peptidoglycan recognition protein [Araneus ventricosus]
MFLLRSLSIFITEWADIVNSFLVGGDGRIYEGRGWKAVGVHTYGCNSKAIGISFMGNFEKAQPSATMIDAAMKLIDCEVEKACDLIYKEIFLQFSDTLRRDLSF